MEPFIGQICIFGFNFPPRGWAHCDGQLLAISQNSALFSLLGTTFGGDGRTTFGLPDLRGRVPVHPGSGPGLSPVTWGEKGGANDTTLTINQIPNHTHTIAVTDEDGNTNEADGNVLANTVNNNYSTTSSTNGSLGGVSTAGGSQAHTNMQPFIGLYFCIALQGIYPSRS